MLHFSRRKEWFHTSYSLVIAMTSKNPSHRTGSNANTGKVSNLGKWESAVVGIRCG